jgi:hypothetical protein
MAKTTALSAPTAGDRVAINTPSRTTSPLGKSATVNPATVARATLALIRTQADGPRAVDTTARTTATWLKPSKTKPARDVRW